MSRYLLAMTVVVLGLPRLAARRRGPGRHRPDTVVPVGPYYRLTRYRHTIQATIDALGPTPPAPPRWGLAA